MKTEMVYIDKDGYERSLDYLMGRSHGGPSFYTHVEREVHECYAFTFSVVDATLGDTDTLNIAFKTGNVLPQAHMVVGFSSLVGGYTQILEAPTWTTNTGTVTAVHNRKRDNNPTVSTLLEDKTATPAFTRTGKILVNVTDLAGGTAIWTRYAWGEKGKLEVGDYRAENEFLLRLDTQYAVLFTAIGDNNKAQIILNWLESLRGE